VTIDTPVTAKTDATKAAPLDEKSKAKLQKSVQDFESMFVGYLLKTMRGNISKEDMFGDSFGGDMLEGMFDLELARHVSRNSNLGLAEMLYKKITGDKLPNAQHPSRDVPPDEFPLSVVPTVSTRTSNSGPGTKMAERIAAFDDIIKEAAKKHGLHGSLIKAVIATESAGVQNARSSKNAKGLMQLIDSTAASMGVSNVWDPRQNIFGGTKYLKQMLEQFGGNLDSALASYNAGPSAVEKHGGIPPYQETGEYVARVKQYLRHYEQQEILNNENN
jgi:Rod binding domain-containing protein